LKELKPNYIGIKINGNNKQCHNTTKMAIKYQINQEIKFLYIKKQQLNTQLYRLHMDCANLWNKTWDLIQDVEQLLQEKMEETNKKLNKKTDKLTEKCEVLAKQQHKQQLRSFYRWTENLTNIIFTKEEQETLDLGLQHSVEQPLRMYWLNPIAETENAIKQLDQKQQSAYLIMAAKKLKQIYNSNKNMGATSKRHNHILNRIKQKLMSHNAIITQADKVKTMVIIYQQDYNSKVHNFLIENDIKQTHKNPINKDTKTI
jgi:hypothetical protein